MKLLVAPIAAIFASAASAQDTLNHPVGATFTFSYDSGLVDNLGQNKANVAHTRISLRNAAWQRVHFSRIDLAPGSFVRMASLKDGEEQMLDAAGLAMWNQSSAYFNGDSILLELIAAPESRNRISIDRIWADVNVQIGGEAGQCGICGTDDRVLSTNDAVARLMSAGCTGTVYCRSSAMLTAGHCLQQGLVAQFRVPASSGACSLINPPVADQFPVISFAGSNGGVGDDYGTLILGTNNLGQMPYHRYGAMIPIGAVPTPGAAVSFCGNGMDSNCTRNQVQQQSTGAVLTVTPVAITYNADLRGGNSGSAILNSATNQIVGIVTHCSTGCPNYGSRIDLSGFVASRNSLNSVCQSVLRLLTVQATGVATSITLSGPDVNALQNGIGNFKRVYVDNSTITLTAPATSNGQCFGGWNVNGSPVAANPLSITINADMVVTANFGPCFCPADFNRDGLVDFFDYLDFVQAMSLSDSTSDFNHDGEVNFFDYLDFVQAMNVTC